MNKQLVILLLGRILMNISDSFYMIAIVWFVKTTTNSPFLVGLTSTIAVLPVTLQFLYGPIIDRYSKKKLLFFSGVGQAVLVGIITLLYFNETLWIPLLLVILFLALTLAEISYPTENTLIERLASNDQLTKVNSVFAFSYQTLDLIADALAGIVILFVGVGIVFAANSIVLLGIGFLFLLVLKVPSSKKEQPISLRNFWQQYKRDFNEGFYVVKQQKKLLTIIYGIIGMNFLATMGLAVLPIISETSAEYGFWLAAISLGTMIGTLISSRLETFALNRVMPIAALLSGLFWIGAFLVNDAGVLPIVLFGIAWIGIGVNSIYLYTLIQVNLPSDYLGTGFSFLSSLLGSLSPLGYFAGGIFGEWSSSTAILLISSIGYFGFAGYFLIHPTLRALTIPVNTKFEKTAEERIKVNQHL
ncbi:MFS transporter [Exiguobacterium sp. s191]|uniref:MFS transporter n=1 Tax=Exiguobacterium sp. s191 TaxID=2751196 RepID=UPI001BE6D2C4|nr:MFS transporter [Exiguobacterium sp. s191]